MILLSYHNMGSHTQMFGIPDNKFLGLSSTPEYAESMDKKIIKKYGPTSRNIFQTIIFSPYRSTISTAISIIRYLNRKNKYTSKPSLDTPKCKFADITNFWVMMSKSFDGVNSAISSIYSHNDSGKLSAPQYE